MAKNLPVVTRCGERQYGGVVVLVVGFMALAIGTSRQWRSPLGPSSLEVVQFKDVVASSNQHGQEEWWLATHFPHCVYPNDDNDSGGGRGPVGGSNRGMAKFVPSEHPPRYDHLSCFVMKSRYNCAHFKGIDTGSGDGEDLVDGNGTGNGNELWTGPEASDYKLVWYPPSVTNGMTDSSSQSQQPPTPPCDFRAVMDAIGGPAGVAKEIERRDGSRRRRLSRRRQQQQQQEASPGPTKDDEESEDVFQVLLMGSSYVRQIFEALICGFRHQITDLKLQLGGPDSSLAGLKLSGVTAADLGEMVGGVETIQEKGCHGTLVGTQPKFFRNNITVPPTIDKCNDDVGMVEFNRSIRFFYIFRPYRFDGDGAFGEIQRRVGMVGNEMDVIASNSAPDEMPTFNVTARRTINLQTLLPRLRGLQKRNLGTFFGADNPWIAHPPDIHPCMPGMPDDQANLLLYLLLADETSIERMF